jgi:hypothetical protein
MTKLTTELDGSITLSLNFKLSGSSLEQEEQLAAKLNELGVLGTGEILKSYDTLGEAIEVDGKKYSVKEKKK